MRLTSLATSLGLAACAADLPLPEEFKPVETPTLLEHTRKSEVQMQALVSGPLDFTGPCVRIPDGQGGWNTIIVDRAEARMARDAEGLAMVTPAHVFRQGDMFESAGGWIGNHDSRKMDGLMPHAAECDGELVVAYSPGVPDIILRDSPQ